MLLTPFFQLFLAAPLLQEGIKEGGIFNVLDTITSTLDRLDFEGDTTNNLDFFFALFS